MVCRAECSFPSINPQVYMIHSCSAATVVEVATYVQHNFCPSLIQRELDQDNPRSLVQPGSPQSIVFLLFSTEENITVSLYRHKIPSGVTGVARAGIPQQTTRRARTILRLLCSNKQASALRELPGLLLAKAFIVNPKFEVLVMTKAENIKLNLLFIFLQ